MKRVTWLIPLLILCVILTVAVCSKAKIRAEESVQALSLWTPPKAETELPSETLLVSTADTTESSKLPIKVTDSPEKDTAVPQSSEQAWEPVPPETEKTTVHQPTEPKPTASAPTEPKPTEPVPTQPEHTEPVATQPEPIELTPTQPEHTEPTPTQPESTEPTPTLPESTEPAMTPPNPTEPQTEPPAEAPEPYDLNSLIAYANSYAKTSYGFVPDSSLNLGNASYYPGFYGVVSSKQDLYIAAVSQIQYTYSCFQALGYDLEGLRCNFHAEYEAATGLYYLAFLYG